ncbi:MAG: CRISPR-associated helicase Cas3' [Magnetococcus sp. MYC-9]
MQTGTAIYWGKRQDGTDGVRLHPLVHHCLEVATVLRTLLEMEGIARRLACSAGLARLTPRQVVRLSALAALHDAGKYNHGFQEQGGRWQTHGHVREIFRLLLDHPRQDEGYRALDLEAMTGWFQDAGLATEWLWAIFCHHGRPLAGDPFRLGEPAHSALQTIDPRIWEPQKGCDPLSGLRELAGAVRHAFPEAFADTGDPADRLPLTPPMQHLFNGLLTWADWIGSDTRFFPFATEATLPSRAALSQKARRAVRETGCDITAARVALMERSIDFQAIFGYQRPNPVQQAVAALAPDSSGSLVILESETGSGKTEAAILHFLNLFRAGRVDGLYFALPTRAAAVQIHGRVVRAVERAFGPDHPPVVLAVPGYIRVDDAEGIRLAPFQTLWPDDPADRQKHRGWAAEHPKRYLAAPVAVGSVDQVLLSALATSHAHLRAATLSRLLLVVDEVHASDAYMTTLLQEVVERHRAVGGEALLMSATLGAATRTRLLHGPRTEPPSPEVAAALPYPLLSRQNGPTQPIAVETAAKRVHVCQTPLADDPAAVAEQALTAARAGARVLVIRNTVRWAIATQQAVEERAGERPELLLQCAGVPAPHHGRYAPDDRRGLDQAIEARFGKGAVAQGGCVAISTQTTEQSLDMDADWIITDLCPMDVLLQRLGRLHRHLRMDRPAVCQEARLLLLTPREGLEAHMDAHGKPSNTAMGHGWGSVYPDMCTLAATLATLPTPSVITLPADNRRLVEAATHPDHLARLASALGEAWTRHAATQWGVTAAQRNTARNGIYDRDQWLSACNFDASRAQRITTRLGLDDRLVRFDPAPMGPFGARIPVLTVPGRWFKDQPPPDALPGEITPMDRAFAFTFHGHRFHYDRLGLRPVTTEGEQR